MNYAIIQPPRHLADYVRFFWFLEGTVQPFVHNAFAYTSPEMIFCYKGQFKYSSGLEVERTQFSGIYGQTETFSKVAAKSDFGIFGFYLYPHAFPQLFCLPANELTNQHADIKTLCGKEGEILEEKIMLASDNNQRVKLASDFLEVRLKNVKSEHKNMVSTIIAISNSFHLNSIKVFAENNFLSVRQFERRFKEFSGFSPKLFLRIARFNSLLNTTFQNKSLTEIAYEYGYYDQSHFCHDFQKFSGYKPKEYFKPETITAINRGTVEFKN
jgi:AraC-like DNA-binding protein